MSDTHRRNDVKDSLVKYEPARLITHRDLSKKDQKTICRTTLSPVLTLVDENLILQDPYSNLCRPADVLDFLFPPIEFFDRNNHKYIICVSRHPASELDVIHLENNLDHRLKQSQALEIGLCSHRREIYDECFDELIRQITIECSERGILLSRVHHTYHQLMIDYSNNYISSNAYAMRTFLVNERIKGKLHEQIVQFQNEIDQLKTQLINAEDHYDHLMELYSRIQSKNEYRDQMIPVELQQLRTINQSLKQDLDQVLRKKLTSRK